MNCPICNSTKAAESIVGKKVYFKCGSEFDAITGEPRLELHRGAECVASCGVCGERLPHHVSHCAGVLKRKQAALPAPQVSPKPRLRKFCELPLGTRFRYKNGTDVWVVLESWGRGKVACWTGSDGWTIGQSICCAADGEGETKKLEVEVVENELAAPPKPPAGEWPRYIVCAAMLMEDGRIVTGVRHFSTDVRSTLFGLYGSGYSRLVKEQGFLNSHGEFLNREEALVVAKQHGQIRRDCGTTRELYSENLY